ncbi:MAG: Pr6Pr family membrane protein [Marinomonas sp.]
MNIAPNQAHDDAPQPANPRARLFAGIIAVIAFAALAVQPLLGDGSYLENLGGMLRYFTIWGNVAACLIMAAIALGRDVSRPVMAALATALTIIAVVYWALLSGIHHPEGFDRITNQFHHTIVPALTIGWWLRFTPAAPLAKAMIAVIMVPPLTYGAFALVLGQATGFYPYFFSDLPALGWPKFLLSNAAFALLFAIVGAGLVMLKNALQRKFLAR